MDKGFDNKGSALAGLFRQAGGPSRAGMPRRHGAMGVLFVLMFFSGVAGLIYEVIWLRMSSLLLGSSALAVAVILTAFMGGLGIGAIVIGRYVDRFDSTALIRRYALLEVGIGLYALCVPWLFGQGEGVYVAFHQAVAPGESVSLLLRFVFAVLLLSPPTLLMGGTLPLASRYMALGSSRRVSVNVGRLYAWNIYGGVAGTLLAGFWLLPTFGQWATSLVAASLNFSMAFLAWRLCSGRCVSDDKLQQAADAPAEGAFKLSTNLLILSYGLSGALALTYEVAWTRALVMVLGTTTYAFTTMLATFLFGLALGSAIYRWIPVHWPRNRLYSFLLLATGLSVVLGANMMDELPGIYLNLHREYFTSWGDVQLVRVLLSAMVMLLPTTLLGLMMPVVSSIALAQRRYTGASMGWVLGANTVGAVVGNIAAALLLIPLLGMQQTLLIAGGVHVLLGLLTLLWSQDEAPARRLRWVAASLLVSLVTAMTVQPWSLLKLNSGVYLYADRYYDVVERYRDEEVASGLAPIAREKVWELAMNNFELLYYREGRMATVSVLENSQGVRSLTINGKTDASVGGDMDIRTQYILGKLPVLLHPEPRDIFVVGLGSGVTAASAVAPEMRSLMVSELSQGVIDALPWFMPYNNALASDRRVDIRRGDARHLLKVSDRDYDVIISQPSNPWIEGESNVFSLEWYQLAAEHLNEDGLLVQWYPSYHISESNLLVILKTLGEVFPNVSLWKSGSRGDLFTIASLKPTPMADYRLFRDRVHRGDTAAELRGLGLQPDSLLSDLFLMDNPRFRQFLERRGRELWGADGAPVNRDDRLITEYSMPKDMFAGRLATRLIDRVDRDDGMELLRGVLEHMPDYRTDPESAESVAF